MTRRDWIVLCWTVFERLYQFAFVLAVAAIVAGATFWFIIRSAP